MKDSLAPDLVRQLNETGAAVIPLPPGLQEDHLSLKACQQYALPEFAENLVLLDSGHAKMMAPFFPLDKLRRIPGLENARYEDPYAGGNGNSVRFLAMCPRGDDLKVNGLSNLYCAGEKAGPLVGHTEAMVTGALAGYNCAAAHFRKTAAHPSTLPGLRGGHCLDRRGDAHPGRPLPEIYLFRRLSLRADEGAGPLSHLTHRSTGQGAGLGAGKHFFRLKNNTADCNCAQPLPCIWLF